MASTELDFALASFWEFAKLWKAGRTCKLVLSCNGGHGEVHLVAGLGAAVDLHLPPPVKAFKRKKTPSQLRREARRHQERAVKVLNDEKQVATEGQNVDVKATDANHSDKKENKEAEEAVQAFEVSDEACEEEVEYQEIDAAEEARNKIVEKVLVYSVSDPEAKKDLIEQEIKDKFESIGVIVKKMQTRATTFGHFNASIVDISPVNLNKIWGRRLGLKSCSIIGYS